MSIIPVVPVTTPFKNKKTMIAATINRIILSAVPMFCFIIVFDLRNKDKMELMRTWEHLLRF